MTTFHESEWTFEWNINNISYCWFKKLEPLESPTFTYQSTLAEWTLLLYPRGTVDEEHVGIYLKRNVDKCETNIIETSFRFVFLNKAGSCLNRRTGPKRGFARGSVSGIGEFLEQYKLFGTEREYFFPEDILIIQCVLCFKEEMPTITKNEYMTLTDFKTIRRNVCCSIKRFSTMLWQFNSFEIRNELKKIIVHFLLGLNSKSEISLKIISWDKCIKSFSFEMAVIDSEKRKVTFGSHKIFNWEKDFIPLIATEELMLNKSRYLPNDILTLDCEYSFSTGTIVHVSENIRFGTISPFVSNEVIENVKTTVVSIQNEPHQARPLVDDLKCMYNDAIHCDIDLRTSMKTFPAHKSILSARSSVFCRMFSNDMREKNSGHVDIPDMDDETVHQMLLYIYTDCIADLRVENASRLYSAADKYEIISLKESCSCFLKDNISPTTVCDLLTLVDLHQDGDLKCFVQDYILAYDKEVFCSAEWKDLMVNNLQLAADVMYRKLSQN